MDRLNYFINSSIERMPWLMLFSVALIIANIVLLNVYLLPAKAQLQQNQNQQHSPKPVLEHHSQVQLEQQLINTLPKLEHVTESIAILNSLARDYDLALQEVHYKDQIKAGEPVNRYAIDFNLTGDYVQIKVFLSRLLLELPHLALQQMIFDRELMQPSNVNVQLKMSLLIHE